MEIVKLSHIEAEPMNEATAMLVFEYRQMFTTCWVNDDGTIGCGFDDPNNLFILPYVGSIETRFPIRLAFADDYKKYTNQVQYVQYRLNQNLGPINQKIDEIQKNMKGR